VSPYPFGWSLASAMPDFTRAATTLFARRFERSRLCSALAVLSVCPEISTVRAGVAFRADASSSMVGRDSGSGRSEPVANRMP